MHTIKEKTALLARVRRIRGQLDAVERALEADAACDKVMHLLVSARAAMSGLTVEILEDHVRTHLVDIERHPDALNEAAVSDLLAVIRTYMK